MTAEVIIAESSRDAEILSALRSEFNRRYTAGERIEAIAVGPRVFEAIRNLYAVMRMKPGDGQTYYFKTARVIPDESLPPRDYIFQLAHP